MATVYLLNSVKVATPTTGTGSVTVGAAEPGYLTPAEAGAVNGRVYTWRLDDGDDFEIFVGTYSSSGPTISRDTVLVSKVGGTAGTSKLNLSGSAKLSVVPVAQHMMAPYLSSINEGPLSGFRNKIINGDGRINQRGASTIGDDTYGHDRHYALTQAGNITVSTLTAPADGIASMMRLAQPSATAKRMGYAQIIEAAETYGLRGKTVTLGGKLRFSAAAPVRFAVLEWTGTADQVTSDVVNNWTSNNYTAGNFFAAGLTVAAVGSITPVANTITNWSITATISSSANNLIVFYWTQNTAAQNATLDMRWYLVEGDATAEDDPFSPRHIQQELALCQRYYCKTYDPHDQPGLPNGAGTLGGRANGTAAWSVSLPWRFPVPMRATPTVTTYSPSTGVAGKMNNESTSSDIDAIADRISSSGCILRNSGATQTGDLCFIHAVADAEL